MALPKHIFLLYLLFCGIGLISCKSARPVSSAAKSESLSSREAARLYASLSEPEVLKYYSGKARLKAQTPDSRVSATLHLRIVKDSVIWATIDKLGFEVARLLITPDSVHVVDRLNKEYSVRSLRAFLDEYGIRMHFRDLQQVLIGNMIAMQPVRLECVRESECDVLMVSDEDGLTAKHWVSVARPHVIMKSYLVDHLGRTLLIENTDWTRVKHDTLFPFERLLIFEDEDGRTEIEMSFSEVALNEPVSLPFSIPGHYEKVR